MNMFHARMLIIFCFHEVHVTLLWLPVQDEPFPGINLVRNMYGQKSRPAYSQWATFHLHGIFPPMLLKIGISYTQK